LGLLRGHLKQFVKGAIGETDVQALIEHNQRAAQRLDDVAREIAVGDDLVLFAFQRVDVDQADDGAVNLVVRRPVGADGKRGPAPGSVGEVGFFGDQPIQNVVNEGNQVRNADLGLEVADVPADVPGPQIEQLLGAGAEAAQAQVLPQHQDGDVDAVDEVGEVV